VTGGYFAASWGDSAVKTAGDDYVKAVESNTGTGSTYKAACPEGTYNTPASAAAGKGCTSCPAGKYANNPYTWECMDVEAGYFATIKTFDLNSAQQNYVFTTVGATNQKTCPFGTYNPVGSSTYCKSCPTGGYVNGGYAASSSQCTVCDYGYYQKAGTTGSSLSCTACATGKYALARGASSCEGVCPTAADYYEMSKHSVSTKMPSYSSCNCPSGWYKAIMRADGSAYCYLGSEGTESLYDGTTTRK